MLSVPYALHAKTATTFPGGIDQAYIEALEARLTALEPQPAAIGDLRAGGVVFWVDPTDNTQGLVCSLSSVGTNLSWFTDFPNLTDVPGLPNVTSSPPTGPGAEIGDGMANTTRILAYDPTAPAALAARSLGPDWYLPSIKELNEINLNLSTLLSVPGFTNDNFYWSSTEHSEVQAWSTNPFTIFQVSFKDGLRSVRAVRAF
jgi:hypothetical protein